MTLENGRKLGPYEIESAAGAGGMGEVYRAKDARLDRVVAIKVLPAATYNNADLRARFEREAKAISSLNHPHICTLYDVGHEDGIDYLVMEYLEGQTLADILRNGPMSTEELYRYGTQIADALDSAHRKGLIHRDLKPGNVIITREGAKLLDFGLAKLKIEQGAVEGISHITQTTPLTGAGTIIGTVQYMAPEQLEGQEADARSDIFAFGALLYEMATGRSAFSGNSQASLIASILKEEPRPMSEVVAMTPPALERLVRKCLDKEPDKRWQSASDLRDELRWISQSGSQAGLPAPLAARRKFRFNLARVVGAVAMALVAVLAVLYYLEISKPEPVVKTSVFPAEGSRLTNWAGGHLALSPDGSKLAFVGIDTTKGTSQLYVRSLNTLTAKPLPGTEDAAFPFWSPDGEYIGFFAGGKLKKILAAGGPALTRAHASAGRSGDWNEDDVIIFTPNYDGPMFRVSAAGGQPEQLTTLDTAFSDYTHRYGTFLPDQDKFLFFCRIGSNSGDERDVLCLSSLSDTSITRLIYAKSNPVYANGHVLFMRDNILMAQPFDPGSGESTGDARPLAEDVSYSVSFSRGVFSVSDNGRLAYRRGDVQSGSQLMIHSENLTKVDTIGEIESQESFALSHDNNFVAVEIEEQQTSSSDIWIYDLRRGIKRRFTFDADDDILPVWSPNDSLIAYRSFRKGAPGIYAKSSLGADSARLLVEANDPVFPWCFSPDGKYLVYGERLSGAAPDLMLYDMDHGESTPYLATEFIEGAARVSPDSRWLAYASNETGKFEIYVSTFPGHSVKWQISASGGGWPKWSRDGKRIYFNDQQDRLWVADVNGSGRTFEVGELRQIGTLTANAWPGFELFSDEQRFLNTQGEDRGGANEMIHVLNWPAELKR